MRKRAAFAVEFCSSKISWTLYSIWLKGRMCIENRLIFLSGPRLVFFLRHQTLFFWQVLVHVRVGNCANLNIGQQNGVTSKDIIDISNFRVWDPVKGTCLNLTFSNDFLLTSGAVFLKVSITSPIMLPNAFWDLWTQPTSQNRMCCEVPIRLCNKFIIYKPCFRRSIIVVQKGALDSFFKEESKHKS